MIFGPQSKVQGIVIENQFYLLNEAIAYLCQSSKKIKFDVEQEQWISGNYSKLFFLLFKRFRQEKDENEQFKLLNHLVKNVVHPYGYNFLSYIVNENNTKFIEASLQIEGVKYMTFKNGVTPLLLAINNKNDNVITLLLDFICKSQITLSQITQEELSQIIEIGIPNIKSFLDQTVLTEELNDSQAQIIENEKKIYLYKEIDHQNLEEYQIQLSVKNVPKKDKYPVVINHMIIKLNLSRNSKQLFQLLAAIENNENEEIFQTKAIQNIVNFLWIRQKWFLRFQFISQFIFSVLINLHVYRPGDRNLLYVLIAISVWYFIKEFIIFIRIGLNQPVQQNDSIAKKFLKYSRFNNWWLWWLGPFLLIYSICTLYDFHQWSNALLIYANSFSWFQFIEDLSYFYNLRTFNLIVKKSFYNFEGLLIFLIFQWIALSLSVQILQRFLYEEEIVRSQPTENGYNFYNEKLFENMNFNTTGDLLELKLSIVQVFKMMVQGETWEDGYQGFYTYTFGFICVAFTNFLILNLIIAIVSDSYEEVMTSVSEKNLKQQNFMILKSAAISFSFEQKLIGNLVFLEYQKKTQEVWNATAQQILLSQNNIFQALKQKQDAQFTELKDMMISMMNEIKAKK